MYKPWIVNIKVDYCIVEVKKFLIVTIWVSEDAVHKYELGKVWLENVPFTLQVLVETAKLAEGNLIEIEFAAVKGLLVVN